MAAGRLSFVGLHMFGKSTGREFGPSSLKVVCWLWGRDVFLCIPCRRRVDLIACKPLSLDGVARHVHRHCCKRCDMLEFFKAKYKGTVAGRGVKNKRKQIWAWEISNVKRYRTPVQYNHPQGAIIWVRL